MSPGSPQVDTTSTMTYRSKALWTNDPTKVGNGILYAKETSSYQPHVTLNLVETDFGNRMRLTDDELDELYTVGPERDYAQWRADRDSVRLNNTVQDQCDAIDKEDGLDSSPPAQS